MYEWSPTSWQRFPCEQAIDYPDSNQLFEVIDQIKCLPPLINHLEIINLRKALQKAERGEAFILQGGDCAESFLDCRPDLISLKLKILSEMSAVLGKGLKKPIISIGRIAGQYTKPRSCEYETIQGVSLPTYRGDLVNSYQFEKQARIPDPSRMLQGYECSAATLDFIRARTQQQMVQANVQYSLNNREKNKLFLKSHALLKNELLPDEPLFDTSLWENEPLNLFTSHEALNLYYEQALTRPIENGDYYNLSTHLPWIGMRTLKLGTAHLELLRGIQNPIGIKIGPEISPENLIEIINLLNPHFESGKLLLISRLGVKLIEERLPTLIKAVQEHGCPVLWSCDPMHGNTLTTQNGIKTRHMDTILLELHKAAKIHGEMNSFLGGVHLELTGEHVTECIGGKCGLKESDLGTSYTSLVDPRLNYSQSMEIAQQLSELMLIEKSNQLKLYEKKEQLLI